MMMVGFSMTFGALFAKTWRIYVLFTDSSKKVVRINAGHMIM